MECAMDKCNGGHRWTQKSVKLPARDSFVPQLPFNRPHTQRYAELNLNNFFTLSHKPKILKSSRKIAKIKSHKKHRAVLTVPRAHLCKIYDLPIILGSYKHLINLDGPTYLSKY